MKIQMKKKNESYFLKVRTLRFACRRSFHPLYFPLIVEGVNLILREIIMK